MEKKLKPRQKAFLKALEENFGIITAASKATGISRTTYYNWVAENPYFAMRANDIGEITLDFVESKLITNISEGDVTSTIFYLKTKGKKRGYVERQELTGAEGKDLAQPVDMSSLTDAEIVALARLNDKITPK